MQPIFEKIYKDKVWYKGSGSGSLPENTAQYRNALADYIAKNHIKTILDIGCGDWQFMHLMDLSGVDYTGIDVVPWLIEENQGRYGAPNIRFLHGDASTMQLPKADLVILKDVLQHWSNGTIKQFLGRLREYPHVLLLNTLTTEKQPKNVNADIAIGEARPIDLVKPPFDYAVEEILTYQSYRPFRKIWETKQLVRLKNSES